MNYSRVSAILLAAAAIGAANTASAVFLAPGGTIFPAPPEAPPGGGVVGFLSSPFAVPGVFSGTVDTTVLAGDPTNPFGGLTFVYRVFNAPGSSHSIGRFTANGFGGWLTDVSWDPTATIRAPALIDRPLPGDRLGFSFFDIGGPTGLIVAGEFSTLVVQTNAPAFRIDTGAVIDGDVATMDILTPVPEPASMAALGLGAAALLRRRKR